MSWSMSLPFARIDRYRRVWKLLGVIWVLSLADLFFTIWADRFTLFYELNPIARHLLRQGATGALISYKLLSMLVGTVIFWCTRRHGRTEIALWGLVFVYVALLLRWNRYTTGVLEFGMN